MKVHNYTDYVPSVIDAGMSRGRKEVTGTEDSNFKDIFRGILTEARSLRERDIQNNTLLSAGPMDNLDSIMIDMEKADIALQFTLQVRNKILDAYQEIMRMQI